MNCQNCGREIPEDANLCPYCGIRVAREASPGPPPKAVGPKPRRKIPLWVLIALGAVMLACVVCGAAGALMDMGSDVYGEKATPAAIGYVPDTAGPTDTLVPSDTPTPTLTPTPDLLTCEDIERARSQMTDLQWQSYARDIVGERIRFAGNVIEVYEDGRVLIDDCSELLSTCSLYGIPLDVAAELNKGQFVQGEGTVREVHEFLGLHLSINVDRLE